ncbi:MAG TPA: helix-turn-helix transcriptional regulator [Trebonia sp.]|nr:helix-turn-helix transcriptional regulator [Trebonia sp.]
MPEVTPRQLTVFAQQVTAWREKRNWSKAQLASRLGFDASYVSHVENGTKPPTRAFAERCDSEDAFGLPGTFVALHKGVELGAQDSAIVAEVEAEAVRLTIYELRAVPGLLQTPAYMAAQLATSLAPDAAEHEVKVRTERQQVLGQLASAWFLLDEAALRRGHGGKEVMRDQLAHLEVVAARPNITLQVLPFGAESQPGGDAPITIVEYADKPTVWLTEGGVSGILSGEHGEVAQAAHVVNLIRAASLSPRDSINFIRTIKETYE